MSFETEAFSQRRSAAAAPRGTVFNVIFVASMNHGGKVALVDSPGPSASPIAGDVLLDCMCLPVILNVHSLYIIAAILQLPLQVWNQLYGKKSKIQIIR